MLGEKAGELVQRLETVLRQLIDNAFMVWLMPFGGGEKRLGS